MIRFEYAVAMFNPSEREWNVPSCVRQGSHITRRTICPDCGGRFGCARRPAWAGCQRVSAGLALLTMDRPEEAVTGAAACVCPGGITQQAKSHK
jgi:hypothetical protein